MTQTTTIGINLSQPNAPISIYAKQHDKDTRKVEASLYAGGQPYNIPGSVSGQVNIAKPDGTGCYYDVDNISGNKVTFTLVEQALAADGTAHAEVSLISTENDDVVERLTSFSFDIIIEKRTIEDSTLLSADYYNALLGLSETVQRSVTFTPSVNSDGVISWTNNGGLTNPASVNIKGPQGIQGPQGPQGVPGPVGYSNAGSHNGIYRGNYLGSSVTAAQATAMNERTFEGLYVGDYWEINNVKYYLAECDTIFGNGTSWWGATILVDPSNIVGISQAQMNTTSSNSTGYSNSAGRQAIYDVVLPLIKSAFGESHIKKHTQYMSTSVDNNGVATYSSVSDCYVELLSEMNYYGAPIFMKPPETATYFFKGGKFPIFNYAMCNLKTWLRDPVGTTGFATRDNSRPYYNSANSQMPLWCYFVLTY